MLPMVSVALPVYNGAQYIESAVRSLLLQSEDLEIVISDDASTDDTIDIVRSIGADNIKLISNGTNGGIFANFNRALRACSGQYIQLFCQDDLAYAGFIKFQLDALARNAKAGLVYASCNIIDGNGIRTAICDDEGTPLEINFGTYLEISSRHGALPASLSSVMVHRHVFDEVGIFDERFFVAGDLEFYNRVAERFELVRNRTILHDVRGHSRSATSNPLTPLRYMREEIEILPFYRRHLGENKYREVIAWRARHRGAAHAKFILRCAYEGKIGSAVEACRLLSQSYNLPLCIWHAAGQKVGEYARRGKPKSA
jgi:glycosyltransferase involved in cell wall biosynthesis